MIIERLTPVELVVTDDEIRSHCRLDEQQWLEQMDIIRLYAAAAQDEAERITRRAIGPGTYSLTMTAPVREVELPNPPLVSIDSITDSLAYTTLHRNGIPVVKLDTTSGTDVTIIYQAGFATVPEGIKAWILLRTATYVENRESDSAKPVAPNEFAQNLLTPYISRLVLA